MGENKSISMKGQLLVVQSSFRIVVSHVLRVSLFVSWQEQESQMRRAT